MKEAYILACGVSRRDEHDLLHRANLGTNMDGKDNIHA